ncbi:unnamed protein product [Linum tenue]|uniref:J domain-containing protein n=1 Tax=Linum tenue TaxID=586396 RepID=A0AAV0NYJ4_9ROSI|nr:unnamed protein product [Linum tenue]
MEDIGCVESRHYPRLVFLITLAKKYHPDANKNNPSAKKKLLEIRGAYKTLHDPEKRSQYDMGFNDATGFGYGASNAGNFRSSYHSNFSDTFRKVFSEIIFEVENDQISSDISCAYALSFCFVLKDCFGMAFLSTMEINIPMELNERQRVILEEFAMEEIKHENETSAEGDW